MAAAGLNRRQAIFIGLIVLAPAMAVLLYYGIIDRTQEAPPPPGVAQPMAGGGAATVPAERPPGGGGQAGTEQGPVHPQVTSGVRPIKVPDAVRGKWRAVKLQVVGRSPGSEARIFTVNLGGRLAIPGTKLEVVVGEFLPALQVSGDEITSLSNEPTNPAVHVTVSEAGKQIFSGWLFGKFPDMQPFEHPAYRLTLVEGVPKT